MTRFRARSPQRQPRGPPVNQVPHLRRRIGYIPTNPQFPPGMTPITYLDYMARLFGLPAEIRKPRLATLSSTCS